MSKSLRVLSAFICSLLWVNCAYAQSLVASVEIVPGSPYTAIIQGRFPSASNQRELRFLTTYGQISDLDQRISEIELRDGDGRKIASHKISAGRFIAESDFLAWSYRVDVSAPKEAFASAHLSWANNEGSLIAPRDLLPQGLGAVRITVKAPEGWEVHSNYRSSSKDVFDFADPDTAVIHAGPKFREQTIKSSGTDIDILIAGNWLFADDEAVKMAESILASYTELFGRVPSDRIQIAIRPFPTRLAVGNWEAGSRGSSITIMSSDMPFKNQSLQRLHEQLRHEIFHLWVPNALSLTGNYDWFYEGFALYQSLKTGVGVNRLRFDDFLDTLARAYDIEASRNTRVSLVSESQGSLNRSEIYSRGMLTAFAADLAILRASNGSRSISQLLKRVFESHHGTAAVNGNQAVLQKMREYKELRPIVEQNIVGTTPVEWPELLKVAGLEIQDQGGASRIKVTGKLTGRQKEVLDRLGYNNWQKLPRVER